MPSDVEAVVCQTDEPVDNDEYDAREFPIDPATLTPHAKWLWERHKAHFGDLKPGDIRFHTPCSQPARVQAFPDATVTDQKKGKQISSTWFNPVRSKVPFLVLTAPEPDAFGNSWCYCLADNIMGYVRATDLMTEEAFIKEAPKYREYLDREPPRRQ